MSSPLPRESNPTLVRSILARSLAKLDDARIAHATFQNIGSAARLKDRRFAARAQILRVRYVDSVNRPNLHGAALASHKARCAREYLTALRRWANNYDTASGFSALRRVEAFVMSLSDMDAALFRKA